MNDIHIWIINYKFKPRSSKEHEQVDRENYDKQNKIFSRQGDQMTKSTLFCIQCVYYYHLPDCIQWLL